MSWGQGSTRAWRNTRALVLARDGHHCQLRYPGCTGEATQVDHTINLASTGTARRDAVSPEDCASVCQPCHDVKTERERRQAPRHYRQPATRKPRTHPADVLS